MTRVIGSLEIIASADAPAWMIRTLVKTLEDVHNRKDVIARLWEMAPSSPLACECLGALYRTWATHKAARVARGPDTMTRPLWVVQVEAARVGWSDVTALGIWYHMYFPLAHWIHSRCVVCFSCQSHVILTAAPRSSRPCPVPDDLLGDELCELCTSVKDLAYLQMLSDAAAKDMSGSKPSGADVLADSEARFTFRPALSLLESTLGWTQTTTNIILADIVNYIWVLSHGPGW
jgi:hypothetical protein